MKCGIPYFNHVQYCLSKVSCTSRFTCRLYTYVSYLYDSIMTVMAHHKLPCLITSGLPSTEWSFNVSAINVQMMGVNVLETHIRQYTLGTRLSYLVRKTSNWLWQGEPVSHTNLVRNPAWESRTSQYSFIWYAIFSAYGLFRVQIRTYLAELPVWRKWTPTKEELKLIISRIPQRMCKERKLENGFILPE